MTLMSVFILDVRSLTKPFVMAVIDKEHLGISLEFLMVLFMFFLILHVCLKHFEGINV